MEQDRPNLSPKDVAYTLLHEIKAQIEVLEEKPEEERGKPDKALTEQWVQWRQRSFDLLNQEGHGEITTELLDKNWNYHSNLFLKLATSYVLGIEDINPSGYQPITGVAREAVMKSKDLLKETELIQPPVDKYVEKLPEPYNLLLGMLFVVDTAMQEARIRGARDAFHNLLPKKE